MCIDNIQLVCVNKVSFSTFQGLITKRRPTCFESSGYVVNTAVIIIVSLKYSVQFLNDALCFSLTYLFDTNIVQSFT